MPNRAITVRANAVAFKEHEESNEQRVKAGIERFRRALEQDAREAVARGSGLPDDWRTRVLK